MITRRIITSGLLATVATGARAQPLGRLCVFGIGGTHNAIGGADPATSPKVPKGVLAYNDKDRRLVPANDPLPGGQGGSPWPAFGAAFQKATGVNVMLVQCAGGWYQTAKLGQQRGDSRSHWDAGGSLVSLALLTLDGALTAAKRAGYDARLSGILWCQGESEGTYIHLLPPGIVTPDDYKAAFRKMVERFRSYYSPTLPFYIFRTGSVDPKSAEAAWESSYALIRAAQEELAKTIPHVIIASRLALRFAERGQLVEAIMFNQDANNDLGRDGAANVAASKLWDRW
jgi:hypothetical protein